MFLGNNITDEHRLKIAEMIGAETIYEAMEYFRKNGTTEEARYAYYKENIAIWRQRGLSFIVNESFEERMAMEGMSSGRHTQSVTITTKNGSFSMPCIKIQLPKITTF